MDNVTNETPVLPLTETHSLPISLREFGEIPDNCISVFIVAPKDAVNSITEYGLSEKRVKLSKFSNNTDLLIYQGKKR